MSSNENASVESVQSQSSGWRQYIKPAILGTLVIASCVSTMYASKDVVDESLNGLGYDGNDDLSVGQNSNLAVEISANFLLWGIPMLTIAANSVLRYFSAIKVQDTLPPLFVDNKKSVVVYTLAAACTAFSDMCMNVLMSDRIKHWPIVAIYAESALAFSFLLPINILGVQGIHGRLERFYERWFKGGVDRQQLYERLFAIHCALRNLPADEQPEKLRQMLGTQSLTINNSDFMSVANIEAKDMEELSILVNDILKNTNLADGSSLGFGLVCAVTIALAVLGGAATMDSPINLYMGKFKFPFNAALIPSIISGITKSAAYSGFYDNLLRCLRHYPDLFSSAPFLYAIGAGLMALSAAGFWAVGENALTALFPNSTTQGWFYLLETLIFLTGAVTNINGAAAQATYFSEEKRQSALDDLSDLATVFKKQADKVLFEKKSNNETTSLLPTVTPQVRVTDKSSGFFYLPESEVCICVTGKFDPSIRLSV